MNRIQILVCYDVNTVHADGQRRLRKVAKACEAYGQRVQWSVFECSVSATNLEKLRERIRRVMDLREDSVRIYTLVGARDQHVQVLGRDSWIDYGAPLIVSDRGSGAMNV